jgi:hypothetical protein
MRRLFVASVLIVLSAVTSLAAQQLPALRFGAHVAGNTANGPFDLYRVGGKVMIPLSSRVYLQGSLNPFISGADLEASAAVRWRPFGAATGDSPFYVGAGWGAIRFSSNAESYDLWLTGLELPAGRFRPYVELQCLGPFKGLMSYGGLNVAIQAYSGITWSLR